MRFGIARVMLLVMTVLGSVGAGVAAAPGAGADHWDDCGSVAYAREGTWKNITDETSVEYIRISVECVESGDWECSDGACVPVYEERWTMEVSARCGSSLCYWGAKEATESGGYLRAHYAGWVSKTVYAKMSSQREGELFVPIYWDFPEDHASDDHWTTDYYERR